MPAPTSSRKRAASPSNSGPGSTANEEGTTAANLDNGAGVSVGQGSLKRQRLLQGKARGSVDAASAGTEQPATAVTTRAEGAVRAMPLVEASNVPQQPLDEVNSHQGDVADKGKGREAQPDQPRPPVRGDVGRGTPPSQVPPANGTGDAGDEGEPAATPSAGDEPDPEASRPHAERDVPAANGATNDQATETSTAPDRVEAEGASPAAEPNGVGGDGVESRDTLISKIQMLERRLQASEQASLVHTRVLNSLHERCNCDVCFDLMTRPCVVAPCGHIACRECLVAYWKQPAADEPPLRLDLSASERRRIERNRTLARPKRCPVCRSECSRPPAEAWLVKQFVGDIERWKLQDDTQTAEELGRRQAENDEETERRRQERTRREAGPSRIPANADSRVDNSVTPSAADTLAAQLRERAARLRQAERQGDAGPDGAVGPVTALLSSDVVRRDDESTPESGREAASAHAQITQAHGVTSARAIREAEMAEQVWADIFESADERRVMFWDAGDHVFRCPECLQELLRRNFCQHCALSLRAPPGYEDVDDDVGRIAEHREDQRGWAADSDDESYHVEHYDPSSPELEGPWLDPEDGFGDEEDEYSGHSQDDLEGYHSDGNGSEASGDLSDFIVPDDSGYEGSEVPSHSSDHDLQSEDEQSASARSASNTLAAQIRLMVQASRAYHDYGSDEEEEDEDEIPSATRTRSRRRLHLDDEEDEDDEDRWPDEEHHYVDHDHDHDDDTIAGRSPTQEPDEFRDEEELQYLYPHYYPDETANSSDGALSDEYGALSEHEYDDYDTEGSRGHHHPRCNCAQLHDVESGDDFEEHDAFDGYGGVPPGALPYDVEDEEDGASVSYGGYGHAPAALDDATGYPDSAGSDTDFVSADEYERRITRIIAALSPSPDADSGDDSEGVASHALRLEIANGDGPYDDETAAVYARVWYDHDGRYSFDDEPGGATIEELSDGGGEEFAVDPSQDEYHRSDDEQASQYFEYDDGYGYSYDDEDDDSRSYDDGPDDDGYGGDAYSDADL